jgi:hypothetical protein
MTEVSEKPVVSEDVTAAFLAAIQRAESIPVGLNLIDTMSDEEWLSDNVAGWNITAGAETHVDEIDSVDVESADAA